MKYNIGETIKIKNDLEYPEGGQNYVNPVEYHFRGFEVKIVTIYALDDVKGYGVTYKNSREFFVHESHIEEE